MSDPSLPSAPGPDPDPGFDSALQDLLKSLPPEVDDGPSPDPARVAAHFSGVGDAALLDAAADREGVRGLLADVADAVVAAEREPDAQALRPEVAAAAIAAFESSSATSDDRMPADRNGHDPAARALPERGASRPRGRVLVLVRVAAAVLLAGGAAVVVALATHRPVEAAPTLQLAGVERVDPTGLVAAEGPKKVPIGGLFATGDAGRMALKFAGGARVVLGAGDRVRVACDGETCGRAALALEKGEALVAASEPAEKVRLLLPGGGVLDVDHGAAQVALTERGEAAVVLRADGEALWAPPGATSPRRLTGPATVLLTPAGVEVRGQAPESVFLDLQWFGAGLRPLPRDREAPAALWRILPAPGAGARLAERASDSGGAPAIRFDLGAGESARVGWLPDAAAAGAERIDVRLDARAALPLPSNPGIGAGGDPEPTRLFLALEGVEGATAEAVLSPGETGPVRLSVPVPAGLARSLEGREAVLSLRATGGPVSAWFTGATFRFLSDGQAARPEDRSPGVR